MRAVSGDSFARVSVTLHPGKQEDKRNPATAVVFKFSADAIEDTGKVEWQVDWNDRLVGGIVAMLRSGADEVFPADERAHGVNGAGLILKKRTGDALVKLVDG